MYCSFEFFCFASSLHCSNHFKKRGLGHSRCFLRRFEGIFFFEPSVLIVCFCHLSISPPSAQPPRYVRGLWEHDVPHLSCKFTQLLFELNNYQARNNWLPSLVCRKCHIFGTNTEMPTSGDICHADQRPFPNSHTLPTISPVNPSSSQKMPPLSFKMCSLENPRYRHALRNGESSFKNWNSFKLESLRSRAKFSKYKKVQSGFYPGDLMTRTGDWVTKWNYISNWHFL